MADYRETYIARAEKPDYLYELPRGESGRIYDKVNGIYTDLGAHPGQWRRVTFELNESRHMMDPFTAVGENLRKRRVHVFSAGDLLRAHKNIEYRNVDNFHYYRYVAPPVKVNAKWYGWAMGWNRMTYFVAAVYLISLVGVFIVAAVAM